MIGNRSMSRASWRSLLLRLHPLALFLVLLGVGGTPMQVLGIGEFRSRCRLVLGLDFVPSIHPSPALPSLIFSDGRPSLTNTVVNNGSGVALGTWMGTDGVTSIFADWMDPTSYTEIWATGSSRM